MVRSRRRRQIGYETNKKKKKIIQTNFEADEIR
jgi:hypothetical protein